jgi:hypothetical protein
VAQARGLEIPAKDLERTVRPLVSLEETFRRLAMQLGPGDEPATIFGAVEDGE